MYIIRFSKQADKDKKLLKRAGLDLKAKKLLNVITENPFQNPPPYEGLVGNLSGYYSSVSFRHFRRRDPRTLVFRGVLRFLCVVRTDLV